MEMVDIVFIVLTYRNSKDLESFFISAQNNIENNYNVIVVNSFYDKESSDRIQKIAGQNGALFINVENKGYGYGNNRGIEYALKTFKFHYLVVSNPDIMIQQFSLDSLKGAENAVIGPRITTMRGRIQNPMFYKKREVALKLIYRGLRDRDKFVFF